MFPNASLLGDMKHLGRAQNYLGIEHIDIIRSFAAGNELKRKTK